MRLCEVFIAQLPSYETKSPIMNLKTGCYLSPVETVGVQSQVVGRILVSWTVPTNAYYTCVVDTHICRSVNLSVYL